MNSGRLLLAACLMVGLVLRGAPEALGAQSSDQLAIVGGYLIDGQEGVPIQNSVVLVEGDRITHVGDGIGYGDSRRRQGDRCQRTDRHARSQRGARSPVHHRSRVLRRILSTLHGPLARDHGDCGAASS